MGKERRVGLFDLLWDDGAVILDDSITSDYVNNFATSLNAFLGQWHFCRTIFRMGLYIYIYIYQGQLEKGLAESTS